MPNLKTRTTLLFLNPPFGIAVEKINTVNSVRGGTVCCGMDIVCALFILKQPKAKVCIFQNCYYCSTEFHLA